MKRRLSVPAAAWPGLPPLDKRVTAADRATWAGTSEATFRGFPGNYGRGLRHGYGHGPQSHSLIQTPRGILCAANY